MTKELMYGHSKRMPEYRIWASMIQRCCNKKDASYPRYGGRGITICDRWRASFKNFIDDVGSRPSRGLCIDRIDNDRGYELGNVRWATLKESNLNKRTTVKVDLWGCKVPVAEIADLFGINQCTMLSHVAKGENWKDVVRNYNPHKKFRPHRVRDPITGELVPRQAVDASS